MREVSNKPAIIILATAAVGILAIYFCLSPGEPVYKGRPLVNWLQQFGTNHWAAGHDGELDRQAQLAVQEYGTAGPPYYLQLLTARESPLKVKTLTLANKPWLARFHIQTPAQYREELDLRKRAGAYGFVILGEKAKPWVPSLMALNKDQDQRTRYLAVFALRCLGPTAAEALPEMIECLDDPDFTIRCDAATAIGEIHQQPEISVAALMSFLEKRRTDKVNWIDSMMAIESLKKFGPKAKPAVPLLLGRLHDPQSGIRDAAGQALKQIDPAAAKKAGLK